jgi:hypothetical protein
MAFCFLRFKIIKVAFDVCLYPGILTSMFCSGSNPLDILFSIKILQYLFVEYVLALLFCETGTVSPKVGVSGSMPLERQYFHTIYRKYCTTSVMFVRLRHLTNSLLGTMSIFKYGDGKAMFCSCPALLGSLSVNYAIKGPIYSVTQTYIEKRDFLKPK